MQKETKIFLDGGDPKETKKLSNLISNLAGQTTNPTLISRNPAVVERLSKGQKFSLEEIMVLYKAVAVEISQTLPGGAISLEVYADEHTSAEQMFEQGKELASWVPNVYVKYPITKQGLEAAELSVKIGLCVNLTLCFTQEQAAAVYSATKNALPGTVFVSPFVGRLDDMGVDGMSLIENMIRMYKKGDGHVAVLAASIRNISHIAQAFEIGSDFITAPLPVIEQWHSVNEKSSDKNLSQEIPSSLQTIEYHEIDLQKEWREYDIYSELTDKGLTRFCDDWNQILIK